MIHINLLPPELRKRRTGVSPVSLSLVGGSVVCLLMGAGTLWLHWRVGNAEAVHGARTAELEDKKRQADEVIKLEAIIADEKKRRDYLVTLLLQKMYWARTLDEFANLLNSPWSMPGYDVRCLDLTIAPVQAAQAQPGARRPPGQGVEVTFSFNWRYKMVGKEMALAGDYIQSFFTSIMSSKWWSDQGFAGRPDDGYQGHTPKWEASIDSMIIEDALSWRRTKIVSADKPRPGGK